MWYALCLLALEGGGQWEDCSVGLLVGSTSFRIACWSLVCFLILSQMPSAAVLAVAEGALDTAPWRSLRAMVLPFASQQRSPPPTTTQPSRLLVD